MDLIHDLLAETARRTPDAVAVRDATGAWTYAELADQAGRFAGWLSAQGASPGDRVLVQLPTTRELVAMFFGTVARGAIFVPINPAMKPYHLTWVTANAKPELVITDEERAPAFTALTSAPVRPLPEVTAELDRVPAAAPVPVEPSDVAALVYTSGSTARPKAVVCPHAQVVFATRAITTMLGYRADDVVLCRFPMSWDYGLYKVLMTCAVGAEVVLAGEESDLSLLGRMRDTAATIVPIVPSLAKMIATLTKRDTGARPPIRMFTNTGAALSPSIVEALRERFPGARVVRQFGQTECKRISIMPPDEELERPGSVGRPLPGTTVTILGPGDEVLPPGEIGEIVVSGPHVMPGYWNADEISERTFGRTGRLLRTGDYGHLDEDGYLYFQGRRDDMFKRKGIRMSVLEIEAAAMDVPGVLAAAAVPPSDRHDLALFVEGEVTAKTVLRELRSRLEPAKVPSVCRVLAEFPLTLHGKSAREVFANML